MMSQIIVIYHGGCRDGFCAAWVINKYLNGLKEAEVSDDERTNLDAEFIPGYYGQEPPDCKGKDVYIVDFCYPLEAMIKIAFECNGLTWLDHHKTAQPFVDYIKSVGEVCDWAFINTKSGAGIAWDFFFHGKPRPWLVNYVEDRDLWAKKLPDSDRVNAYIACLEFNFEVWDIIGDSMELAQAVANGIIAEAKTEQYVREVCKNAYFANIVDRTITLEQQLESESNILLGIYKNIPVVNICQVDCSEVLHELCKKYPESPFSLYWFKRQDGLYQYGLRSIGEFDCSTVAKLFGGGGHKNAAGFQLHYLLEELK
jgi:uncharacterized protein